MEEYYQYDVDIANCYFYLNDFEAAIEANMRSMEEYGAN